MSIDLRIDYKFVSIPKLFLFLYFLQKQLKGSMSTDSLDYALALQYALFAVKRNYK